MKSFAVNVVVHRDGVPHHFEIGDEAPEWAIPLCGSHCFEQADEVKSADSDDNESVVEVEAESDDSDGQEVAEPSDEPAPKSDLDFTKPVTRTRRK